MIWLGILIGIAVMQTLSLIVIFASNENDDICYRFVAFLYLPFLYLIKYGDRLLTKIKYEIKYKSLIVDDDGKTYHCSSYKVNAILEKYKVHFAKGEDFKEYMAHWNKRFCFSKNPNIRYAPRIVWKQYPKWVDNENLIRKAEEDV